MPFISRMGAFYRPALIAKRMWFIEDDFYAHKL